MRTTHKLLLDHGIDIMKPIWQKNYFEIVGYKFYDTKQPNGKEHGGTGILRKDRMKWYALEDHLKKQIQATSIRAKGSNLLQWQWSIVHQGTPSPPNNLKTSFKTLVLAKRPQ